MKGFRRFLWLLSGILLIVCGAIILFSPGSALLSISLYIGIGILLAGILGCAAYFAEPKPYRSGWMLFEAILDVVLGILLLFSGWWQVIALMLPILFSVWIIVRGFIGIIDAIESRYMPGSMWGASLALAIIFVVLGVLSLMDPVISAYAIAFICGISLILSGVVTISMWARARKLRRSVKQWRASMTEDEAAFIRDNPMLYALLKRRMIDGEFEDDEEA